MSIFNLFKKKTEARPIFAVLGTDMHCHLIPQVDDGSKCMEESIDCLNTLKAVGYNKVIITPHFQHPRFPNTEDDIVRRYEEVKRAAREAGVEIEIAGIGGEYRIDSGFKPRLENPRFLKVADKYVLVEFSLHQQMMGCDEMIFDMQMKGYEVILAHPERYPYLSVGGTRMEQLKNQGVFFQVNALSLGGFYGEEAKRRAFAMLDMGIIEFMGTDTHNNLYAQALTDLSCNRKVEKVLEKYEFLNKTLL
jgi:tyrosine-protein phosphatase YwqE